MMRRCSVMRMPLATHCASMKFGLVSVTTKYPSVAARYYTRSRRKTSAADALPRPCA